MRGAAGAGARRRRRRALAVADALLAAGLVAPAVVGYWRGTWGLMDRAGAGWGASLALGLAGHLVFALAQRPLEAAATSAASGRLACAAGARLYTAVFGFCCVNAWRGTWKLLDRYAGGDPRALLATAALGVAALAATRTLRNISAPPFVVATDTLAGYFVVPTMFRVPSTRHAYLYVLDCLFSVLVVGNLVVFVWRGTWNLLDLYLYPGQPESSWASLALGYGIVALTFLLQPALKSFCARLRGFWRLLVADVYLFVSFCGTVNVWRGVWNALNDYFLKEWEELSYWVTHAGCLLLLMLLNCSNSVLVRGVYIDAEEDGGLCVVFPTQYLRHFLEPRNGQPQQQQHNYPLSQQQQQQQQQLEKMLPSPPTPMEAASPGANHLPLAAFIDAPETMV